MTDINSFNEPTSLALIELLRARMRNSMFSFDKGNLDEIREVGYLFRTPAGGIPARAGITIGKAECEGVVVDENDELVDQPEYVDTVYNVETVDIPGDIVVRAYFIADQWVVDPFPPQKVKFRATANIQYRKIAAQGVAGEFGTLEITDPHNLWSTVTRGGIGTAFKNRFGEWEVETCSLPANEILVELKEKLLSTTTSGLAKVADSYALRSSYPNVMKPPEINNCGGACEYTYDYNAASWSLTASCAAGCECSPVPTEPPVNADDAVRTFVCTATGDQTIQFQNTWKLDAKCDSKAIIRRISNADWGKTHAHLFADNGSPSGSASDWRWELVAVENRKARWIQYVYTPGEDVEVDDFWDGEHPTECEGGSDCSDCDEPVEVIYPVGEPCEGDTVLAKYDPRTDKYIAFSTESAMLGEPVSISPLINIANDPCGVEMTRVPVRVARVKGSGGDCEFEPVDTLVQMGVSTPVLLALSSESCGTLNAARQQARLWLCDSEIENSTVTINLGDKKFVTAASFGPRTCTGSAEYTWNTGTNDWDLTTPCSSGCESVKPAIPTPLPTGTITTTAPCNSPANEQCGLNLTMQSICETNYYDSPAQVVHVPLPLEELIVSGEIYKATGELAIERWKIYVCNFEAQPDDSIPLYTCPPSGGGSSSGG